MMNRNTSPHSRPQRTARRRSTRHPQQPQSRPARSGSANYSASTSVSRPRSSEAPASKAQGSQPPSWKTKLKSAVISIGVAHLVLVLSIVLAAVAFLLVLSQPISLIPTIVATAWLVFHAAPVAGDGIVIDVIPLLPVMIMVALIVRRVHVALKHKASLVDLALLYLCTLLIPMVLTAGALAMLADAHAVYPVSVPPVGSVFASVAVVHTLAFFLGLGPRVGRALARKYQFPSSVIDGAVLGVKALGWLCVAALALGIILVAFGWERQGELLAAYPRLETPGLVGLIVLSLLFIPNAMVAIAGVLVGSEYQFGAASVSLFDIHLVPLPPIPILGIIPASVPEWGWVAMAIPAVVIAIVMVRARPNPVMTLSAGLTAGIITVVVVHLSGGVVGAYDPTGLPLWMTAGLAVIWVGGIALAVSLIFVLLKRRTASSVDPALDSHQEDDTVADHSTFVVGGQDQILVLPDDDDADAEADDGGADAADADTDATEATEEEDADADDASEPQESEDAQEVEEVDAESLDEADESQDVQQPTAKDSQDNNTES